MDKSDRLESVLMVILVFMCTAVTIASIYLAILMIDTLWVLMIIIPTVALIIVNVFLIRELFKIGNV